MMYQPFLCFLQSNLWFITSTGADDVSNNDLIPHILLQLWNTKIPLFQQSVLKWYQEYMENKLSTTLAKLVAMADDECQVLKPSHQWVEIIDQSIAAMQAAFQTTNGQSLENFKSLAAKTQQHCNMHRPGNPDHYESDNLTTINIGYSLPLKTCQCPDTFMGGFGISAPSVGIMGVGYAPIMMTHTGHPR